MQTRLSRLIVIAAWAAAAAAGSWPACAVAQASSWPSSSPPRPLPSREADFPPYEIRTLPNGLRVVVVVHDEQPAVSLKAIVKAGPAQDPTDRPGVASMVASLLDQGTATRTAQQLADVVDSAGATIETGIGRELSYVDLTLMKDDLDLGATLLADVLRRPAFAADDLERQRRQMAGALQVSYQDPAYLADVLFDRVVYGQHPYGAPGNGTPASVETLTREDLAAFHRRYYAPNNCLLAVVGDVTVDGALAAVTRAFGDWESHPVPPDAAAEPPKPARRVIVLDKPDAVQTEIRAGHIGIARKHPEYMAVNLAVKVLGGAGANRLHRVLRAERGLTYGARADLEALKRTGQLAAQTSTRTEATGQALRLIVEEFARLRREGVEADELNDAKAYLAGHFPLTIETPDEIATQVLNALFYDLPIADELQKFRQRVNAVNLDDIQWVVNRYVQPDRLSIVLVGNASAFLAQLQSAGFKNVEVVRLADLDLARPDLRQPPARGLRPATSGGGRSYQLSAARYQLTAAGGLRPATRYQLPATSYQLSAIGLIDRAIAAKGGLEKLKAVKTLRAVTSSTFNSPQGPVTTETTTYIEYPDRFRVEARLPVGEVVQVYAGADNVWMKDPVKGILVPPPQAQQDFRDSVHRDVLSLLLRAHAGSLDMILKGPESGPGAPKTVYGVELSAKDLDPVTLFIDVTTGMVVRQSYSRPDAGGVTEESFSDYRDVDGVKIAYRASLRRDGQVALTRSAVDVQINVPIDRSLFVKPEKNP